MANTLFLMSQSPHRAKNLSTVVRLTASGDAIAFVQDGVYFSQALPSDVEDLLSKIREKGATLHFLEPDLKARGLNCSADTVTYDGLLDLIEKYDNVFH